MEEWLSYRLGDFLMFSGRTYWRMFELQNAALWPLPVAAPAAGGAALVFAWRRVDAGLRLLASLLAIAWATAGWSFVWQRYAEINWGVAYAAPLFGAQALVLAFVAASRTEPGAARHLRGAAARALLLWGILLHPIAAPLFGRPLAQAEVVGVAPDPTAIATLGLALLLPPRSLRLATAVIPALWLAFSALTLWLLGGSDVLLPLMALVVAAAALVARR